MGRLTPDESDAGKGRLLVTGSPERVTLLRSMLNGRGYQVETCASGADAVLRATSDPFDLALVQTSLPDLTGYEVCERLREAVGAGLPVILISPRYDPSSVLQGLAAGAHRFLVEPFDEEQVLSRVRSALAFRWSGDPDRVPRVPESVEASFRGHRFTLKTSVERAVHYLVAAFEDILRSREALQESRQADQATEGARDLLQGAMDALSGHIAILDEKGTVLAVNEAWRRFAGVNGCLGGAAGVGVNYLTLCGQTSDARRAVTVQAVEAIREVASGEREAHYLEYPSADADDERWFSLRVTRFRQAGPPRVVVVHHDITDHKLAELELRRSEARLAAAQHVAGLGWWEWDIVENTLWWSDEIYPIFGLEQDEFGASYEAFLNSVHPEDRPHVVDAVDRALNEREPYAIDHRVVRPDGTERVVHEVGEVTFDASGKPLRMTGTVHDITERTRAEDALRRSEADYRGLVQGAMHGIYKSSSGGKILMANPALVAMLGFDSEEELLALESAEELYVDPTQRQEAFQSFERGEEAEIRVRSKDGRIVVLRVSGKRVADAEGGGPVFHGMAQDITEQVALEEQLQQAQRLEALGQLAGGVAHDFNNILSVIIVEAQLGMRRLKEGEPMRERFAEIKAAADRAADLTRQLLGFSRKQVIKPVVVSLDRLVTDVSSMLSRLIAENIRLTIEPGEATGNVLVDRGQIEQVLTNLVVNARDAMPRGGDLTIRTAAASVGEEFCRTRPGLVAGPCALLEVCDTGTGIPDDVRPRMFDPFFTTKPHGKGTGLGLATVYGIVKKMDGYVEVDSEVGVGTTIRIYLPIVDEEETASQPPRDAPVPLGDETVLLVEDDVRLRRIARQLLEEHGYTVLTAEDGVQALERLAAFDGKAHLLLTDIVMPNMGGRELVERVLELRPETKVLFMSGYTDDDDLRARLAAGDTLILQKPFTADSLASAVREALDQEQSSSA